MDKLIFEVSSDSDIVSGAKAVADRLRNEVGFINRNAFVESAAKGELLVAHDGNGHVLGFVRFHHRRDRCTTLYEIGVLPQRRNLGRRLIKELEHRALAAGSYEIHLKCPVNLPANDFYRALGYRMVGNASIGGRQRRLVQWVKMLPLSQSIEFIASFTSGTYDFKKMVQMWEQEIGKVRPFDRCIISPLFADPGALASIRHIQESWGVGVVFDSGGFYVQQGKITYENLYVRLMKFYQENQWADVYVLPDYVPTSQHNPAEVWERVQVTATEGIRFFKRLPDGLKFKALGVLQGHNIHELRYCFELYRAAGVNRIGFGSFDTGGRNSEINLVTKRSRALLTTVSKMLWEDTYSDRESKAPALHLFGVGSPRQIIDFRDYGAASFDSSGWQRTAGYGNVYLPFVTRRNITHGSSSIALGPGLDAVDFYRLAEQHGHSCVFCNDFRRLQKDRFARMWHNAIVVQEMVEQINGVGNA